MLLVVKMAEGAMSQEMQAASQSEKGKREGAQKCPWKEHSPFNTLVVAPTNTVSVCLRSHNKVP